MLCNMKQDKKELQKNVLNYVGFPIKVFVPFKWSRLDQQHYVLCTWRKTKPIPLLCDAHFEELSNPGKCPGGKIVFCQRVKYISTIGDILIQGYLMLMDALQNLLFTQRKICNGNQEIYCNINHHVFRRSKAHGCDGRKLTPKTIRICNHCTTLSELISHRNCWIIRSWSHGPLPHPV